MVKLFGTTRRKRIISFFLLITLVSEIVTPTATFALTGGPSQPEAQAFTPVSTAEMVDLTSGDFRYNIPLMDVGGYPLNVAYSSGIGMDDEASWTGLGWNLNVGTINRSMRGLPDDFKGEIIEKEFNMKDNNTFGVTVGAGLELFGYQKPKSSKPKGKLNIGLGISYNNYTGIGMEQTASIGISVSNPAKNSMNASLGMKSSNSGGLTISPNLSFSAYSEGKVKGDETTTNSASIGIGMSMNSRSGLKDLSVNSGFGRTKEKNSKVVIPTSIGPLTLKSSSSQSGELGSAGVINFGASSYMPRIQNSMVNTSVAVSFKFGTTVFGLDGDITLGGYFSNQSLKDPYTSTAAYGYMFSQAGQNSDNVLMDFNREKDQSFSRYTKNLPVTNQTYDVFSVSGQGIGGAFRPFRSEVGYVFDNKSTNTSDSYSASGELAAAQTAHLGVNISVVDVNTVAGKWENDNDAKGRLYARHTSPNKDYEPYYFKEVGEKSADDVQGALYTALGGDEAYRIKIDKLIDHRATNELEKWSGGATIPVPAANYIPQRQKRNQVLSTLSFDEAKQYGLDKKIYNRQYAGNTSMNISTSAKAHHIAEITALRIDGSRYIYGLPAYNTHQEEITFNASSTENTGNTSLTPPNSSYTGTSGNVSYNAQDISTGNKKGIDHYYNRVKTPAYAHSYLLTAIVSPDYVDVTDNGPDDGDFGNYTKFEYEKVYNTAKASDKFGWRMPYEANKANFNESGKSIQNDDQGNLVYGEKELWFVKKIITKSYVAVFELGDRHDALAAQNVNGGQGSNPTKTKYLKSITLYAKPEYDADVANNYANAVPIKVVHFVYDYSLCPGVLNNDGAVETVNGININATKGKLTLKEVYFTYGKSDKAKVNKYMFNYGQVLSGTSQLNNFAYHPKAYDRWGNYMPLNNDPAAYANTSIPTNYAYNSALNNAEYPYTDQFSKAHADFRASAWNLSRIDLPSGAVIKVNYEADDYAFVQNRPAMQMMKVVGISDNNTINSTASAGTVGELYSSIFDGSHKKYLFFELTENLNYNSDPALAKALIAKNYLKDIHEGGKYLYFRFLVNLTNTNNVPTQNTGDHFEYVSGYAELNGESPDCGIVPGLMPNGRQVGFVQLNDVVRDDKTSVGSLLKTNPITKASLNFGKVNYNNLVWDASFSPPSDVVDALKQLASEATGGPFKTIMQAIKGPNNSLMGKKYCQEFVYGKSWIRLYNPNGHKFGGGSRVKSLSINDSWTEMTGGQQSSEYGQDYSYETALNGESISSGVASYEPMLGGDENPFRQPVFMGPNKFTLLVPDERFFMEEPFGETFFPSASVSYSKVKVKNRIPVDANVKTHGTGSVVHEFYTAKDYPTITSHTPINPKQYKPPLGGLLKVMSRDYVSASQGYVIKLNDMHGKPKAQSVYAEGSTAALSKVEYFYKTKGNGYTDYGLIDIHSDARCTPNELDNSCVVIDQKGDIRKTTIGVDFDAVADFRETQTTSVMGGAQINLSMFLVGVFPGIVPSVWPDFSYEKTRFRSAVITKVISQYAVLEKTTAYDNGSSVTTSNLAFDAQTGDVLVTKTKNDFHDDIYSLKYPAFWGYDLMGAAYKNIGYSETVNFSSAGVATVARPDLFQVGDEVSLGAGNKGWVCSVSTGSLVSIMDQAGNLSATGTNVTVKILRSGRRNLLGSPMASLTSMVNPVDYGNDGLDAKLDVRTSPGKDYKILNTSAIEYSDQWQTFKGYEIVTVKDCRCSLTSNGLAYMNTVNTKFGNGSSNNYLSLLTYNTSGAGGIAHYTVPESSCDLTFNLNPNTLTTHTPVDWSSMVEIGYFHYDLVTDSANCSAQIVATSWATISSSPSPVFDAVQYTITPNESCGSFINCSGSGSTTVKCGVSEGDKVNPFFYGIKGSWRPKTTWSYLEGRTQTASSGTNNMDIRNDGTIREYYPFYDIPASGSTWTVTVANSNRWTYTSEVTKNTPLGMEVENKDALGRYSSALYGYNGTLPVAVASNAQLQEIAYDGFEDYGFSAVLCNATSQKRHFDFSKYTANITVQEAHSGNHSIKVGALSAISISNDLGKSECTQQVPPLCNYALSCSDFIYPFAPLTYNGPKKYILSYWIRENTSPVSAIPVITYPNSSIGISVSGSGSVTMGTLKKSEIIDGWQRVEQDFTISAMAGGSLNVTLQNSASSTSYFDDIRIHPFNSNMKSFVYDPVTLKYVAELDANNFATFYEYDEEGSLVRVKKETERGIMTIKETKNHTKH